MNSHANNPNPIEKSSNLQPHTDIDAPIPTPHPSSTRSANSTTTIAIHLNNQNNRIPPQNKIHKRFTIKGKEIPLDRTPQQEIKALIATSKRQYGIIKENKKEINQQNLKLKKIEFEYSEINKENERLKEKLRDKDQQIKSLQNMLENSTDMSQKIYRDVRSRAEDILSLVNCIAPQQTLPHVSEYTTNFIAEFNATPSIPLDHITSNLTPKFS